MHLKSIVVKVGDLSSDFGVSDLVTERTEIWMLFEIAARKPDLGAATWFSLTPAYTGTEIRMLIVARKPDFGGSDFVASVL